MAGGLGKQALPEEIKIFRIVNGKKTILTFDLNKIRDGEISDPLVQANDYIIIPRSQARAFLTDSLFRDVADFLNPFRFFWYH
jgi:protein involved in polysaccharide export with SLBB domain